MVLYYIVPLVPLTNSSDTKSFLEIPITLHSREEPVFDLSLQDVQVRLPTLQEAIYRLRSISLSTVGYLRSRGTTKRSNLPLKLIDT